VRQTHLLKCWPIPFEAVRSGLKRHEVRVNDRDFRPGDRVVLLEFEPATTRYSGRKLRFEIGHVSQGGTWSLPDSLCVFSLLPPKKTRTAKRRKAK
jgi:hypothetical protein